MFGRLKPILRGVRGPHAHSVYVVEGETLVFGRAAGADIQILDQRVSRQHARLHVEGDTVFLEDLQSHNGTFVHGFQVHRRALRPGDRFRIGVAEYTFDKVRDKLLTSAVFLNKLTTRETLGATIVRKAAHEILNSPTAEMPATEAESSGSRPTRELTALGNHPLPAERPLRGRETAAGQTPEPAYVSDARARAIDLPAQRPGAAVVARTPIPLANAATAALADEPAPQPEPAARLEVGLPTVDAPELQALLGEMSDARPLEEAELAEFTTVPLDPKSQRVRTPIPRGGATLEPRTQPLARAPLRRSSIPAPVPAPAAAPIVAPAPSRAASSTTPGTASGDAHDAAVRTIDAVMRLLALRFQESGGAPLRVTDRANLRKLEQALRDAKRGSANRRRWSRRPCELQAEVGPLQMSAQVLDIGAGGLRISNTELTVVPGDQLTVRVHLGEGRLSRMAIFETKVAWVDDATQTFGGAFSGPATWKLADQP